MHRSIPRRRRWLIIGSALALVAVGSWSYADTKPTDAANPKTPVTVSADALPTVQINGVVWQQTIIGNTVYAAGSFSKARPAGAALGTKEVTRDNLLAYDLTTGALKAGFVANLNAQAKTVTRSPDGTRLYIGGDFTTVNGTTRYRVAALNPTTGAVLSGFAPSPNARVQSIVATNTTVYLGGIFSKIGAAAREKVGAVTTTGAFLPAFKPIVADGSVLAMVLAPDNSKLVLGGSFTALNRSSNPGYGLGAVDPKTGAGLAFAANSVVRDAGTTAAILSLTADATTIYGTGYLFGPDGNFEGVFAANWDDTALKWLEDCHGDTYDAYPSSTAVYLAGHPHFCGNVGGFPESTPLTYHRAMAFGRAATGLVRRNTVDGYSNFAGQPAPSLLTWFPDINFGTYTGQTQGAWNVTGSGKYVVYGGEFTKINNVRQQGLARFATSDLAPNKQGPRASGAKFTPTVSSAGANTVKVSWPSNWDRDNQNLTYTVLQDNVAINLRTAASTFWHLPVLTYTATGVPAGTHSYKVRATDPFGVSVTSPIASFAVKAAAAPAAKAQAEKAQAEEASVEQAAAENAPAEKALVDKTPAEK